MNNQFLKIVLFVFKYDFILSPAIFAVLFIVCGMQIIPVICSFLILVCIYKAGLVNILIYKLLDINVNEVIAQIKQKLGK